MMPNVCRTRAQRIVLVPRGHSSSSQTKRWNNWGNEVKKNRVFKALLLVLRLILQVLGTIHLPWSRSRSKPFKFQLPYGSFFQWVFGTARTQRHCTITEQQPEDLGSLDANI